MTTASAWFSIIGSGSVSDLQYALNETDPNIQVCRKNYIGIILKLP